MLKLILRVLKYHKVRIKCLYISRYSLQNNLEVVNFRNSSPGLVSSLMCCRKTSPGSWRLGHDCPAQIPCRRSIVYAEDWGKQKARLYDNVLVLGGEAAARFIKTRYKLSRAVVTRDSIIATEHCHYITLWDVWPRCTSYMHVLLGTNWLHLPEVHTRRYKSRTYNYYTE